MIPLDIEIDQDWRSIIRDACDLEDLHSRGDGVKGYFYAVLGQVGRPSTTVTQRNSKLPVDPHLTEKN